MVCGLLAKELGKWGESDGGARRRGANPVLLRGEGSRSRWSCAPGGLSPGPNDPDI